ncbi:hypothetical protein TraAM80_10000, partial [Trypanosoma rangeli]
IFVSLLGECAEPGSAFDAADGAGRKLAEFLQEQSPVDWRHRPRHRCICRPRCPSVVFFLFFNEQPADEANWGAQRGRYEGRRYEVGGAQCHQTGLRMCHLFMFTVIFCPLFYFILF